MGKKNLKKQVRPLDPNPYEKKEFEPMDNPFLDSGVKVKVPVKTENGKGLFDKPMENPFAIEEESPQKELVPSRVGAKPVKMPKRKSREEVSASWGWARVVKRSPGTEKEKKA